MKPVRVLVAARRDIDQERSYYNSAQKGLGERFARAVAQALRLLSDNPKAMQKIEYGMRRWPVKGFPHGVMYSIETTEIIVISVFNPSQDPAKWQERL